MLLLICYPYILLHFNVFFLFLLLSFVCAVVPSILMPQANFVYTVNETDPVVFTCFATGIPPPEITWTRNGVYLDDNVDPRISLSNPSDPEAFPTTRGDIYSVSRNLIISNTRDNVSGTYTCVASNRNARTPSVTRDFELVVQGRLPLVLAWLLLIHTAFSSYLQFHHRSSTPQTTSQLLNLKMPLSPAWPLVDPGQQLCGSDCQI